MFLDSILRGKYRKTSSHGRNPVARGRVGSRGRQLRLEPLEVRSLLSGVPGLSSVAVATPSLSYDSRGGSSSATQLVFVAPHIADLGVPATMALEAVNSRGLPVSTFSDSVTVASSPDTTAKVSTIVFHYGIAFFTVTFDATGSQTLTATDTAANTTIPSATATTKVVNPAVATQLELFVPRRAQVGVPVTMELAALNAQGEPVQGFSDPVTVASSPDTTATVSPISFTDGIAVFTVTFGKSGSQTLTATDTAAKTTIPAATATINVVNPAVATKLELYVPRNAQVGVPVTVQLDALNAQGQPVQNFSDTVTVTSSPDTTATVSPITFTDGIAVFTVTFDKSGSQTLTATDTTANTTIPAATATINVANPAVATKLALYVPRNAQVGVPVTVQLAALNAQGQPVQSFSDTVTVTSTPDTTATVSSITFTDGIAVFTVTFDKSGSQTLTATDTTANTTIPAATATIKVVSTTPTPPPSPTPTPTPTPTPGPTSPTTSSNWSGYSVETASGAVSAVSGSWKVPTVTGTGTAYCAQWVGIDGFTSTTVEQIGTESDVVYGQAQYSVWYEMYPAGSVTISTMNVKPGDAITASVVYNAATTQYPSGYFALTITDTTTTQTFSIDESASGAQRSSAEWIVEAPSSSQGLLPLANFGSVTFTNASATINGVTGPIDNSGWQYKAINMGTSSVTEDSTSGLTDSGGTSSFTVTYLTSVSTSPGGGHGGSGWATDHSNRPIPQVALKSAAASVSSNDKTDQVIRDQVFASFDLLHL